MNHKIIIFLFFLLGLGCYAKPITIDSTEQIYVEPIILDSMEQINLVRIDSLLNKKWTSDSEIYPKNYTPNFENKYRSEDFEYNNKPKASFGEKLNDFIHRLFHYIFGSSNERNITKFMDNIYKIISTIIIGFLIYLIIRYLMKKNGALFFSKKNSKINIPSEEIIENIHEINFPNIISKYEKEKQFRWAIRYQFLFMLKKLTDKNLIEWNPEKTNKDYINEIITSDLKKQFKQASYIFEYIWYGEFPIDEATYEQYKSETFNF